MVELVEPPHIVDRPRAATIGIRVVTPFRGMLAVRDGLMREIRSWSDDHRVDLGPLFMRLHVVDMAGDMDIEVGAVADVPPLPDGRIRRGELQPAAMRRSPMSITPYAPTAIFSSGQTPRALLLTGAPRPPATLSPAVTSDSERRTAGETQNAMARSVELQTRRLSGPGGTQGIGRSRQPRSLKSPTVVGETRVVIILEICTPQSASGAVAWPPQASLKRRRDFRPAAQ